MSFIIRAGDKYIKHTLGGSVWRVGVIPMTKEISEAKRYARKHDAERAFKFIYFATLITPEQYEAADRWVQRTWDFSGLEAELIEV